MLYRIAKYLFLLYFTLLCRHKVFGTAQLPQGRCIIAPNHASFYDPPIIAASWPTTATFLARKSLFSPPFFGRILERLNTFPVGGSSEDLNSLKNICQLLKKEKAVIVFPEGTRTPDGHLQPIKSGIGMLALRSHADIVPTYIHGSFEVWPRTQKYPSLFGHTACVFGTPIHWEEFKDLPRKEAYEAIAQQTASAIEKLKEWYDAGAQGTPP